ncbi:MAG: WecB/TagA/CpsF family glycosyltransferase [Bacteroidota bacterium]|nr:WecB/TagA/CpsF family glycosyltransferase [Bacteroidota bacterium]
MRRPDHAEWGPVMYLAGIPIKGLTRADLFRPDEGLKRISTINAEGIVWYHEDPLFRRAVQTSVVCVDGQIPYWLLRLQNRHVALEKLSGSDLVYDFAAFAAEHDLGVFLLGAHPEANRLSVEHLRMRYGARIAGYAPPFYPYPFPSFVEEAIWKRLCAFRPAILFVAFGMPKQERWLYEHHAALEALGVRWAIGVGGAFEFASGRERRAPRWVQQAGLEAFWRFVQRPARWRRLLRAFKSFYYVCR